MKTRLARFIFILSGLLPVLGGINTIIMWTMFVGTWFWRQRRPFRGTTTRMRFAIEIYENCSELTII
jgi:hypothetical protein